MEPIQTQNSHKRMVILLGTLALVLIGSVVWYISSAMQAESTAVTGQQDSANINNVSNSQSTTAKRTPLTQMDSEVSYAEIDAAIKSDNESDLKSMDLEF